jgi:predicted unusual protein kinase regulating ubiquinone biosynthesis (AarF/ABC1/UbiB family)
MWGLGLVRILYIVGYAVRAFVQLWWYQSASQAVREQLLAKQAQRYVRMATRLQGLTIKVGQFLSTRVDVLPAVFTSELERLTDQALPIPWRQAERVLRKEWGPNWASTIAIDPEPIASASIAVVYKGTILESGQTVAIKIQRPSIPRLIRADLRAIRIVHAMARWYRRTATWVDWRRLYKEIADTILQELDFRMEMENARAFAQLQSLFRIRVPNYDVARSTTRVLVMEWIDAVPITDDAFRRAHGIDDADLINRLVRGFIWQLRQGELFHADPHAGNIQVQRDGTIVFFDFGMVGRIRKDSRTAMVRLIQSMIVRDQTKMMQALEELGFIREGADRYRLQQALDALIDYFLAHRADTWDEQLVQDVLGQIRYFVNQQPIQMPAEFAFFGRAMGMLVGIVTHLDPTVDYLDLGKKILPDLKITDDIPVDQIGDWARKLSGFIPVSLLQAAREWIDLPGNLNRFMQSQTEQEQRQLWREGLIQTVRYYKQLFLLTVLASLSVGYMVYALRWQWPWLFLPGTGVLYFHIKIRQTLQQLLKGGH